MSTSSRARYPGITRCPSLSPPPVPRDVNLVTERPEQRLARGKRPGRVSGTMTWPAPVPPSPSRARDGGHALCSSATFSLKNSFRKAKNIAKQGHKGVFLELFSGCGAISKALSNMGFAVLAFDIRNGPQYDLTKRSVLDLIRSWILAGEIAAVWFGTPWSNACRPLGSTPFPHLGFARDSPTSNTCCLGRESAIASDNFLDQTLCSAERSLLFGKSGLILNVAQSPRAPLTSAPPCQQNKLHHVLLGHPVEESHMPGCLEHAFVCTRAAYV